MTQTVGDHEGEMPWPSVADVCLLRGRSTVVKFTRTLGCVTRWWCFGIGALLSSSQKTGEPSDAGFAGTAFIVLIQNELAHLSASLQIRFSRGFLPVCLPQGAVASA
mmetsp:Transcript_2791/g.5147  ORF Transcript_2791/g.5147 Transcript_2791/m.5147 type:complete len:107 (-) Transcript_2791:1375-1695(-)